MIGNSPHRDQEWWKYLPDVAVESSLHIAITWKCSRKKLGMSHPPKRKKRKVHSKEDVTELIRSGQSLVASGKLDEALAVCDRAQAQYPDHFAPALLKARIQYRIGKADAAIRDMKLLGLRFPDQFGVWNDLGLMLTGLEKYAEAEAAYRKALSVDPLSHAAAKNLMELLILGQRMQDAEEVAKTIIHDDVLVRDLGSMLAQGFQSQRRFQEAAQWLERLLKDSPAEISLYQKLASVWREANDSHQLEAVLKRWLGAHPENAVAMHLLGSLATDFQTTTPTRASDEYVRHVFDRFAEHFDQSLAELDYQAPRITHDLMLELLGDPQSLSKTFRILDAGCGTGLCGPFLKTFSHFLCGLDLSSKMLDKAKECRAYDQLIEAELTEYLSRNADGRNSEWDLIVACDALNYFGELEQLLQLAFAKIADGGWLMFTVETHPVESDKTYILHPTGRFSHAHQHIKSILHAIGFGAVQVRDCILRRQAGGEVRGAIVAANRALASH